MQSFMAYSIFKNTGFMGQESQEMWAGMLQKQNQKESLNLKECRKYDIPFLWESLLSQFNMEEP